MTARAWERQMASLWDDMDAHEGAEFVRLVDALAAELPAGDPVGLFERASARDSTGRPDEAVPLYAQALEAGLEGVRRRRAVIQMASSIRNLGDPARALALLSAEAEATSDELDGAVATFMALALADLGREREAVAVALAALSEYLPRYNRSAAAYAQALTEGPDPR
jgi:tetratricopeptide (TPR) repeat protein